MTLRLLSEQAIRVDVAFIPLQNAFIYYVQLGRIHQEKMAFTTTCLEIALVANMLRQRERGRHNSNSKAAMQFHCIKRFTGQSPSQAAATLGPRSIAEERIDDIKECGNNTQ